MRQQNIYSIFHYDLSSIYENVLILTLFLKAYVAISALLLKLKLFNNKGHHHTIIGTYGWLRYIISAPDFAESAERN